MQIEFPEGFLASFNSRSRGTGGWGGENAHVGGWVVLVIFGGLFEKYF
jgi:hypothetical protein